MPAVVIEDEDTTVQEASFEGEWVLNVAFADTVYVTPETLFDDYDFKINQFMNIFFYAEHLSFQELIKTLQPEYKIEIDKKVIEDIEKKFQIKVENDDLPWKELAAAIRRFISRYLVGERQTTDIDESLELAFQLTRRDLWGEILHI